jgi:25S rRNA (uracil2634-N3)-methyltransferase
LLFFTFSEPTVFEDVMPKIKKQKLNSSESHPKHHDRRKPQSKATKPQLQSGKIAASKKQHKQTRPSIVPFDVFDNILLVGEGDLSFTLSLLHDHGCASLTATTYDTSAALVEKYPHVQDAIQQIKDEDQVLLHGIDATKLSSYKELKKKCPYDRIIFTFPHTGGLSTDVNRQVRANQALLSSFFQSSIPLLSPEGTILVTLFEAEPYTLWNIRDLARHAGLVVLRSWKFERDVYPLYRHARTVGVVKTKTGDVSDTAWKGEERPARTYEFGLKEGQGTVPNGDRKRKGVESSDEDDD